MGGIRKEFFQKLERRLKQPLPGAVAHEAMRATPVGSLIPKFEHPEPPRPGAVLILLHEDGESVKFPLIKRPEYSGAHSGQVSFPGGKTEPGEDAVDTALREAWEEIGIDGSKVEVLGKLTDFFVMPSNFLISPVVAIARERLPALKPNPREVARILSGNLSDITRDDAIRCKEIIAAGRFRMMAPHFEIDGEIVWGATAMILNEFCLIVKEIGE